MIDIVRLVATMFVVLLLLSKYKIVTLEWSALFDTIDIS